MDKGKIKKRGGRGGLKRGDCCCHALEKMGEHITLVHSFDYNFTYTL
jgi:hypothetical protein